MYQNFADIIYDRSPAGGTWASELRRMRRTATTPSSLLYIREQSELRRGALLKWPVACGQLSSKRTFSEELLTSERKGRSLQRRPLIVMRIASSESSVRRSFISQEPSVKSSRDSEGEREVIQGDHSAW